MGRRIRSGAVGGLLIAALATGCAAHPAGPRRASVTACTAYGYDAIEHHIQVRSVPAACRGLTRAQVNFAVGRAIFEAAGSGLHKSAWRHRAAVAGARLAPLVTAVRQAATGPSLRPGPVTGGASKALNRAFGLVAFIAWLLTVGTGAFMLGRWILRGGLRRRRVPNPVTGDRGLPPVVVFAHFGLAVAGLALWAVYLASGLAGLAWAATALLLPVTGLGITTVMLWVPYPTHAAGGDDPAGATLGGAAGGGAVAGGGDGGQVPGPASGMLAGPAGDVQAGRLSDRPAARALTGDVQAGRLSDRPAARALTGDVQAGRLTEDAQARRLIEEVLASIPPAPPKAAQVRRRATGRMPPLVPVVHGVLAVATILFAVLTAIGAR